METTTGRFLFQQRNEPIDWRRLASVDVDRVAREVDVDAIQDNIQNVTYCNVEHEVGFRGLDHNFVKLFKLSQLMIEYLLHCQDYLQQCLSEKDELINNAESKTLQINQERDQIHAELTKRNESYKNLKKELQKCKKLIGDYQLMVRAGASGLHKCAYCQKSFVSEQYLHSHILRRHPDNAVGKSNMAFTSSVPASNAAFDSAMQDNLLNELNQIKSRLTMTEKELQHERLEQSKIREEESDKYTSLLSEMKSEQMKWKLEEEERSKREMEKYKSMMMEEIKHIQNEKTLLEKNLHELRQQSDARISNLGELQDDDDKSQRINDIYEKLNAVQEANEINLLKAEENSKRREKNMKLQYDKKLNDAYQRIQEHDEKTKKDELTILNLASQLEKFKKSLSENKHQTDSVDSGIGRARGSSGSPLPPKAPPTPPPRDIKEATTPVQSLEDEQQSNESVCHWVSTNNGKDYRVFKAPSSSKSEWKDLFTFFALQHPSGQFDKPLYVYSCGMSPGWRQYVSSSSAPPKPNYKLDYVFYGAESKLLGTVKLNVLDAGSGTVIRSVITKEESLEGWKAKDLWFYAMKAGSSQGLNRSVTINSDQFEVTESGDEVSVSSYTGTEDVKRNLVEALKLSRENLAKDETLATPTAPVSLLEDDDDTDDEKEDTREEVVPPKPAERRSLELPKQNTISDKDNLAASSSTSVWDSLLFEKGQFLPFPNNPLAVARYKHDRATIDEQRNEIIAIFDANMQKRGIDPDETRMSKKVFDAKMKPHENEKKGFARQFPDFMNLRMKIASDLDDFVLQKMAGRKSGGKGVVSKFKTSASKIKSAMRLSSSNQSSLNVTGSSTGSFTALTGVTDSPSQISTLTDTGGLAKQGSSSKHLMETEQQHEEPEYTIGILHQAPEATPSSSRNLEQPQVKSQPTPAPRPRSSRPVVLPTQLDDDFDDEDEEEEEEDDFNISDDDDSEWDSDPGVPRLSSDRSRFPDERNRISNEGNRSSNDFSDAEELQPYASESPTPYQPKLRAPQGEKVKELAASLELSLANRGGKKKLAGAVDLSRSIESQQEGEAVKDVADDDEDDDSDFSLTEPTKPTMPNQRKTTFVDQSNDFDDDDDDIENLLASYEISGGAGRKQVVSSTPKRASTAVTAFNTNNDFSDDDSDY